MHTLIVTNKVNYRYHVQMLVNEAAGNYEKACYVSFTNPFEVIVEMIDNANVEQNKFIVIEANGEVVNTTAVTNRIYIMPIRDLFEVYMMVRNLIKNEGVEHVLIDSLSTLISKYGNLPLKETITNLLLEIGTFRCGTSIILFNEHQEHEVVDHLKPLIGRREYL